MVTAFGEAIEAGSFVQLSLGNYAGQEEGLKGITVRKVMIRHTEKLSFTFRFRTRDIVKNHDPGPAMELVARYLAEGFRAATLFTLTGDLIYQAGKGQATLKRKAPSRHVLPEAAHDKRKQRRIEAGGQPFLAALKITDRDGKVLKHAQDKYRQINHYVEILSKLLDEVPGHEVIRVTDMGSGKGYLTFALYEYLTNVLGRRAEVTGVEFRPDLVALCNEVAGASGFDGLKFVEGTIQAHDSAGTHMLIALHACDTATDDAIFKGISAGADLIVVAPCCHKQVRREMEKSRVQNDLHFLTDYGIFMERQAEMVTDGLRALILEYFGYKTKVFEFISDVHTPKNAMITAVKSRGKMPEAKRQEVLRKIRDAKVFFGVGYHHLERMLGI